MLFCPDVPDITPSEALIDHHEQRSAVRADARHPMVPPAVDFIRLRKGLYAEKGHPQLP